MSPIHKADILLVEDDRLFQRAIKKQLERKYAVTVASTGESALKLMADSLWELVLLDIMLPGIDGMDVLKRIKASWPEQLVIMLTGVKDTSRIVEAVKAGAYDYIEKSLKADDLFLTIDRALESYQTKRQLHVHQELQLNRNQQSELVGNSSVLDRIREEIAVVSKTDTTVLIEGDTGTGKEVVANMIHSASPRAGQPFVVMNCAAIPRDLMESELFGHAKGAFTGAQISAIGKFELADTGTIFLDEIGELLPEAQVKILRVLESQEFYPVGDNRLRKVDVRVIAATNRDLGKMIEEGLFREDLYFRLNVYRITVPPLRERPQDILALAFYFIEKYNRSFGKKFQSISAAAKERLLTHQWEGNIRELRNVIERVVLTAEGRQIKRRHLEFLDSKSPASSPSFDDFPEDGIDLEEVEKSLILQALKRANLNKTKAAKLLNLTPPTLYYRLEKYGLN